MTVTNREIYVNALGILGENVDGSMTEDYEERASYLIPAFCCVAKDIDKNIRKAEGAEPQPSFSPVYMTLDSNFPLSDQLASAAALYLAAMLVIDENSDLSDSIYDKYCDSISSISASINAFKFGSSSCESIVEKYFFD